MPDPTPPISWRISLRVPATQVYRALNTTEGRESFWAHSAKEVAPGVIEFRFRGGEVCVSRVLARTPQDFSITYFHDSVVTFHIAELSADESILTVTESGVPAAEWNDNFAGWVSVLLTLKAAVQFRVDLRNGRADRPWRDGFVDQ